MSKPQTGIPWGGGWYWPLPTFYGDGNRYDAVISQEFRDRQSPQFSGATHYGVDVMYRDLTARWPYAAPALSAYRTQYFAPEDTPVLAAREGTLWSVERTSRGWAIVLDHGKPFATFYQHLSTIEPDIAAGVQGVKRGGPAMKIEAGRRLGIIGSDPMDSAHVRHLHFAVWYQGAGDAASVDPSKAMESWKRVQWART